MSSFLQLAKENSNLSPKKTTRQSTEIENNKKEPTTTTMLISTNFQIEKLYVSISMPIHPLEYPFFTVYLMAAQIVKNCPFPFVQKWQDIRCVCVVGYLDTFGMKRKNESDSIRCCRNECKGIPPYPLSTTDIHSYTPSPLLPNMIVKRTLTLFQNFYTPWPKLFKFGFYVIFIHG